MATVRHLRGLEAVLQANSALELVSGMVDDLLHPLPLVLADALEAAQRFQLLLGELVGVDDEG